jgi:hypothetical protein
MGGEEFDRYKKIFDNLHNNNDFPDYNHEIYNRVIEEGNYFIQPSVVKGSGQFPIHLLESGREPASTPLMRLKMEVFPPSFHKEMSVLLFLDSPLWLKVWLPLTGQALKTV